MVPQRVQGEGSSPIHETCLLIQALKSSPCPQALVDHHKGQVPASLEELEQLAGVGHKTASVVMAVAFK